VRLGAKQLHLMDSACLSDSGMVPQHYPKARIHASAVRWTNPGRASASCTQVSVPEESDSRATGDAVHSGERHFKVMRVENMARDPDRAMRV
jgi:hypothetical protein